MKNFIKFLFVLVTFLLITGCTKEKANYFRHLKIDNKYNFEGKYPVNDKDANLVNCYHFIYDENGELKEIEYLKGGRLSIDNYFEVAKIIIERSNSFEKRIFQNVYGKPTADNLEVYSQRLKLNENGEPVSLFNYDKDGKLTEDFYGVSQYLWTLNEKGQKVNSIRINKKGERITDNNGIYELRWEYNEKGNKIQEANFGKDGQLVDNDQEYSIKKYNYDNLNNPVEISFLGTDEQLKEIKYMKISVAQLKYDEYGNTVEEKYLGTDEQIKENSYTKIAIVRRKYDFQGNLIEIRNYGIDEQLKENQYTGAVITKIKYDTYGNAIEESYFGIDEKIIENTNTGIAIVRRNFDEYGNLIEEKYFDKNNNLKSHKINDAAITQWEFDKNGTETKKRFYDTDEITGIIKIGTKGNYMEFDKQELKVKTGSKVKLILENNATSPAMKHNIVITKRWMAEEIASAGLDAGERKNFVPNNPENIIAYTKLTNPGEKTSIKFKAPEPGIYDFVCTFPGHNSLMKGEFIVEK